jgi:tetratricopeptide (TPR) repeat protein
MRWVAALAVCLCLVAPAWAQGDWGATRAGFDATVVRRYKAILSRDPHDADALRQLVAIYGRYKSLDVLSGEYAAEGETWAALCVRAHMPGVSRDAATGYLERALAVKPDDGRGWIALGELTQDAARARDAFRTALAHVTGERDRRRALDGLLAAARSLHDWAAIDSAYVELIAMKPRDGSLWLARGDAQLAAGKPVAARTSYIEAEKRLRSDPERRLTAMTNAGVALERQGKIDDALAQWEATLDAVPRGFYMRAEIVRRIIATERNRKRLGDAERRLEARWPERRRGYFEWSTLGELYDERGELDQALAAYRRALAIAPTELPTQRKLIALLDRTGRVDEALAQHEAAARLAPGDAEIQLALARRYGPAQRDKANAVLARLSRRMSRNVGVRDSVAKLYDEWNELPQAISEYEAIANLEPNDIDHAIVLGEAYWAANDQEHARAAWARLAKIGTFTARLRQGEVLSQHEQWLHAVDAFTAAITADPTSPDPFRERARALDALERYADAAADARRAVALVGAASQADGERERGLLARVLGHLYDTGDRDLEAQLVRWRFAFEHGDNAAGYVLAAHHQRIGSGAAHAILVELYRRIPGDDSLGIALARSYAKRRAWDSARRELERVGRRNPKRAGEIAKLADQLRRDEQREELAARYVEAGMDITGRRQLHPDIVGRDWRLGVGVVLGTDIGEPQSALGGTGLYISHGVAPATALVMWFESYDRNAPRQEVDVFALGANIERRVLDLRKLEVAAQLGAGVEYRHDREDDAPWNRFGLAARTSLEIVPRGIPETLAVTVVHSLTDDPRSTSILVQLGLDIR